MHGMAGFGKTVLAAEAVRDATLLREVFPGEYLSLAMNYRISLTTQWSPAILDFMKSVKSKISTCLA